MKRKTGIYILVFFGILLAAILVYNELTPTKISAIELARQYAEDKQSADKIFLNQQIEVRGKVKAYYKIMNTRNVLELNTTAGGVDLFCFFTNSSSEFDAGKFPQGTDVIVRGKCVGTDSYNFVKGCKIEVDNIIKQ